MLLFLLSVLAALVAVYVHRKLTDQPQRQRFFRNKVVWVTGASSGIGRSVAIAAARAGAHVVLSGRDQSRLEEVKSLCKAAQPHVTAESSQSQGPTATPGPALLHILPLEQEQLAQSAQTAEAAVERVLEMTSQIDVLVCNAGISTRGTVADTNLEVDRKLMDVNYFGTVSLIKACLPTFLSNRKARIGVVSSVQGHLSVPRRAAYSASKHALNGFCNSLRYELADQNVTVTLISPGYVRTALPLNALKGDGSRYGEMDATTQHGLEPDFVAEQALEAIARGEHEALVCDLKTRVAVVLNALCPRLVFSIIKKRK